MLHFRKITEKAVGRDKTAQGRSAGMAWSLVACLVVIFSSVFHETAFSLVKVWYSSRTYGHGFLILPIALYLGWQKKDVLLDLPARPSWLGVLWIAGASALWLIGAVSQTNLLQHVAFVGMLQAAVITVMGVRISRALLFPLGYLFFMVPFGDFAIAPLQDLTARYATDLLRFSGIPVYLENWSLVIPGGAFLVAEACAGVRFLIASLALGALIAGTMFSSWTKRIVFMLLSIAVPIAANVVRAYGIVVIAHLSDFELAVGVDHLVYGFVFLSFVMLLLIGLAYMMRDPVAQTSNEGSVREQKERGQAMSFSGLDALPVFGAGAVAVVVAIYGHFAVQAADMGEVRLVPPDVEGGWILADTEQPLTWYGDYKAADAQQNWVYRKGDMSLTLFSAYYSDEGPGKELINQKNSLMEGADYQVYETGILPTATFDMELPAARYRIMRTGGSSRTVVYWYVLADGVSISPVYVKRRALIAKLGGGRAEGMVVAVAVDRATTSFDQITDFMRNSGLREVLRNGGFSPLLMGGTGNDGQSF